ncbi:DoxX family protein [Cyanobium sp. Morenito 9A2]|uniref:DoxX family protein n=1 Tax=Cyanobium sp. Morenito 9A2 TaxID=2823718 RepID=UPI0020CBFF35|nr:DoxX family protein [Cyanobium sp. Morenito 9A2]MCP9848735.1 DoxX family protein [Cyanobium sp. Morenito 9A2]
MGNPLFIELFLAFLAALITGRWLLTSDLNWGAPSPGLTLPRAQALVFAYLNKGWLPSLGLLVLRLAIGLMMIHHGQEKLADPHTFARDYVVPLHLPFPLVFAELAGFSEILGSWCLILGFLTPLGALALSSTMAVAATSHILAGGLNIYVLELVVLYLGGSLALLATGPGRFSIDAALVGELTASAEPPGAPGTTELLGES